MEETRQLLAALREINGAERNLVSRLTPSLIGMFGSQTMFDLFLGDLDEALKNGSIPEAIKRRAGNLASTFIPQVADLNGIKDAAATPVTSSELRSMQVISPRERRQGVILILAALMKVLDDVLKLA